MRALRHRPWRSRRRWRPHRGHQRTGAQIPRGEFIGEACEIVIGGIDIGVRQREEEIGALETNAIHGGGGGEVEHCVKIDRRLGIGTFADEAGPHGIVEGGKSVGFGHGKPPMYNREE